MCLMTLQDRVRKLGMGAMYEGHLAQGGFRDLFDDRSPEWASTPVPQKVIDLKAFEAAGVPVAEVISHYRETLARAEGGDGDSGLAAIAAAMQVYRQAGYAPPLPPDVEAAVRG
ncbi:MAG: hypothetical protein JWO31_1320 [Phycisphaerales bacterium]|nr:hypothetical protein [Phycisphaerales bacterium]